MRASESGVKADKIRRPYRCFLLRCRLEKAGEPAGQSGWRFTVQQVGADAARRTFTCLHDVAAYFEVELMSCGPLADEDPISIQRRVPRKPRAGTRSRGGEEERR